MFLVFNDDWQVIDKTFSQLDVDSCRRRSDLKEELIVGEHTLTLQTAIVFDARTTPRQLTNTNTRPAMPLNAETKRHLLLSRTPLKIIHPSAFRKVGSPGAHSSFGWMSFLTPPVTHVSDGGNQTEVQEIRFFSHSPQCCSCSVLICWIKHQQSLSVFVH